jgi:hypothetical protein
MTEDQLAADVTFVMKQLSAARADLDASVAARLTLSLHARPEATAILIDCRPSDPIPKDGRIQVEYKLFRVSHDCSFGYLVAGGSEFFRRNLAAWHQVLAEAEVFEGDVP